MFVITKKQFDTFRVPLRKKNREAFLLDLKSKGAANIVETKYEATVEDSKGRKSLFHYSEQNLLSQITKPSGVNYQIGYDDDDRLNKIELANKETLQLKYKGELPENVQINKSRLDFIYNKKNQIAAIKYPDDKRVLFNYNENDQLISVTNRANETQSFNTTIQHKKLVHQLKDSLGRQTSLIMDSFGGVEKLIFPDGTTQEVSYNEDLDAQVVKLRNGKTKTIYSGEHFPDRIEWQDGTYQQVTNNEVLQVESVKNNEGILEYSYDDKGRLLSESFLNSQVNYVYDEDFLKSIVYPSGLEVAYEYNDDDQLKAVKIGEQIVNYEYDNSGTLEKIKYPSGVTNEQKNLVFSGLQASSLLNKSGEILSKQTYSYDILGRLVNYKDFDKYTNAKDFIFEYDAEGRLTSNIDRGSSINESYAYDGKGNIIKANVQKIEIGKMDEILRINGERLEYDAAGNLLGFSDEGNREFKFKYADNNTLKSAKTPTEIWEYSYDALGRRIAKSNGKETCNFFWSGDKLLTEEHKKNNTVIVREYIYTDSNTPIAFKEEGKIYWLQTDARGAVIKVHNDIGEIVWSASYNAFGKATISINKIVQPWRLAGQYFDQETGLHYNLARYYSPYLRSYLSLDAKWLLFEATNYSYAANDPYNKIDTDGNWPECLNASNVVSVGAGIVAGVAAGAAAVALIAAAGVSAPVIAGSLLIIAAVGAISGLAAGITESVVKDLMDGKKVCLECALKAGLEGAALGAILGPLGKLTGRALRPLGRLIKAKAIKKIPWIKKGAKVAFRKQKALKFYTDAGMDKKAARSHMKGIDFDKPVRIVKIPPEANGNLSMYAKRGADGKLYKGQYYAVDKKTTPSQLGISDKYNVRDVNGNYTSKVKTVERIDVKIPKEKPVTGLKSTSKKIDDHWSLKNKKVATQGGGTQIFIPKPK